MKILAESLSKETKFNLHFEWREFQKEPAIGKTCAWFRQNDNGKLEKTINHGFAKEHGSSFVEHVLYEVYGQNMSRPSVKKEEFIIGSALTTYSGVCMFEIAFQDKIIFKEIQNQTIAFQCDHKSYDEKNDILTCHLIQASQNYGQKGNGIIRIVTNIDGYTEAEAKLQQEADEKNQNESHVILEKIKQKKWNEKQANEKLELQRQYDGLPTLKKWIGGRKLKQKYKIAN